MIGKKFQFRWFLSVLRVVTQVQTERAAGFRLPEGARNLGFYGRGHEAAIGTGRVVILIDSLNHWQVRVSSNQL